jgi:hypothetical protein
LLMLLLPLNLDYFLRDDPPQYQAVHFSGGTSVSSTPIVNGRMEPPS